MPPTPILNPAELDCSRVLVDRAALYKMLPQQYEFSQLDGIIYFNKETGIAAGYRDVRDDEWWCRGHMPGRPIFPGVLMLEAAAQLASYAQQMLMPLKDGFLGFGGVDKAKFRGAVIPPARIILIGKLVEARQRRFVCAIQSYVDGNMVFEGEITGMPIS